MTHDELKKAAIGWLYNLGCQAFAEEVPTANGVADALGIKGEDVYYVEAKASRADLICPKQKRVYQQALVGFERGIWQTGQFAHDIDFYYVIVADGVAVEADLYPMFGVLDERGKVVRRAKRFKTQDNHTSKHLKSIAHRLVYQVYGKLYLTGGVVVGERRCDGSGEIQVECGLPNGSSELRPRKCDGCPACLPAQSEAKCDGSGKVPWTERDGAPYDGMTRDCPGCPACKGEEKGAA